MYLGKSSPCRLFSVKLRPAQELSTYIETSPLPVKGCKIYYRPMLDAQGLWAGRNLYRAKPAVTRDLDFSGLIRKTHMGIWRIYSNPDRQCTAAVRRPYIISIECCWILLHDCGVFCVHFVVLFIFLSFLFLRISHYSINICLFICILL